MKTILSIVAALLCLALPALDGDADRVIVVDEHDSPVVSELAATGERLEGGRQRIVFAVRHHENRTPRRGAQHLLDTRQNRLFGAASSDDDDVRLRVAGCGPRAS